MLHSGMGPTHVVNFLSTCNSPPIDATTLKKQDKKIFAFIIETARNRVKGRQGGRNQSWARPIGMQF